MVLKELTSLVYRHFKYIRDVLAVISDLEGFPVVTLSFAHIASDIDVGQEMHLDLVYSVSGTSFASSALCVERESAGTEASGLGIRSL